MMVTDIPPIKGDRNCDFFSEMYPIRTIWTHFDKKILQHHWEINIYSDKSVRLRNAFRKAQSGIVQRHCFSGA